MEGTTQEVKVGMIGGGQIARAHVLAYKSVPLLHKLTDIEFKLAVLAEASETLAKDISVNLGFETSTGDWKSVTRSDRVDLIDIVTPTYLHTDPAIDAAEHHKDIICEKPLATTARAAKDMLDAATKAGIVHVVAFNYRRLSAVTYAKELVERGELGKIYRFRAGFLEDWGANVNMPHTWRYGMATAGGGALADLGSHALDLGRFILGDEIAAVCGLQETFIRKRRSIGSPQAEEEVDVDDSTLALLKFRSGTIGTLEANWSATGRKALLEFEINGSEGSVYFTLERPSELMVYFANEAKQKLGYRTVLMGPAHPYGAALVLPAPASGLGYEESLVNEIYELAKSIREKNENRDKIAPSFYDGWKVNQLIEAIQASNEKKAWVSL